MKMIILVRHAKSSWGNAALDDHDRPLNRRGRAAAPAIAEWLTAAGHTPDTVLCSSSLRTRQTVDAMRKKMPELPAPVVEGTLYLASATTMRGHLSRLPGDCETVMLVAHQPGTGVLAQMLADGRETPNCQRAFQHFPTAAAAVFEADIQDWQEIATTQIRFVDFAVPRELARG